MWDIELTLPFPPSVNHYWRRVGNRTVLSMAGRRYKIDAAAVCLERGIRPLAGRIEVEADLYPPTRLARDIDNYAKALLDAMSGFGYADDGQIDRLELTRREVVSGGKAVVRIRRRESPS